MLSALQKKTAEAIVNVFETGRPLGEYGRLTFIAGDPGRLTYGRTQATLASGGLYLLIRSYCGAEGALLGDALKPYLGPLARGDATLDSDRSLHALLREAGEDAVMHEVQDAFFDRVYWEASVRSARNLGAKTALGVAVIYDGRIHGSWVLIMRRVNEALTGRPFDEREWIARYVGERKSWLAGHEIPILRRTIYRMKAFEDLIGKKNWDLALPLSVLGVQINEAVLSKRVLVRAKALGGSERNLLLADPLMRGEDVRKVQEALITGGASVSADGLYGAQTEAAVRAFQARANIISDGIVGPATLSALGL